MDTKQFIRDCEKITQQDVPSLRSSIAYYERKIKEFEDPWVNTGVFGDPPDEPEGDVIYEKALLKVAQSLLKSKE